jgi:hypothetical protein
LPFKRVAAADQQAIFDMGVSWFMADIRPAFPIVSAGD